MMLKRVMGIAGLGVAALIAACGITAVVYADTLVSPNYQFEETVLGSGGLVQSSSANYQGGVSIGDTGIANSASTNFQIDAGSMTSPDPTLSFTVNSPSVNFGNFTASGARTATSAFSVSNYTSYGYIVQIAGNPPSNGSYTIPAMSSTGPSVAGTGQFGINLVANTAPESFGQNPDQGMFGFGVAAANYNSSNQYRYVSGETIASAPKSSGITTYTISYIVNVDSLTPGGQYTASQVLICTGTY